MRYLLILLAACLMLFSCKKEKAFLNVGEILGFDLRQCPCIRSCPCTCGGLIFHFTDEADTTNIVIDNAAIFQLPANTHYPIQVKVNWQNTSRCGMRSIKITDYNLLR